MCCAHKETENENAFKPLISDGLLDRTSVMIEIHRPVPYFRTKNDEQDERLIKSNQRADL
ncbi:hypothetical protein MAR_036901 [Mya arenaria]|uniref:Uncharacterized protein n=1 Tax=Mya arenaria TaxID=6604 RepID=A0ABY7FQB8_MYAAR|nr:hypothetical protein MAR_036901 [Mya arenaria]